VSASAERAVVLDPSGGLDALVRHLAASGYRVVGPVVRNASIVYDDVERGDELPAGSRVEQAPGRWRLLDRDDGARFGWTPGADSWKKFVHPSHQEVLRIRRRDDTWVTTTPSPPDRPLAIVGARDCEVRALDVLDAVLAGSDPRYSARRADMFVVAVTCGVPASTCWCTSMGGAPRPDAGHDVVLTEVVDDRGHRLVAEAVTDEGDGVLGALLDAGDAGPADDAELTAAADVAQRALDVLTPRLPGDRLPDLLDDTASDPYWDEVARRCLSCGNCTMVCPTCFCATFEDTTTLTGDGSPPSETVRTQHWASCFELDHSNLGGQPVRATTASRYRQWLTHKLATWPAQFGTPGCVGCGRCTTWCPAAIDLPREAAVLARLDPANAHFDEEVPL
jgi:ferredoxin